MKSLTDSRSRGHASEISTAFFHRLRGLLDYDAAASLRPMNIPLNGIFPGEFGVVLLLITWLFAAIVHIGFAAAVWADAANLWHQFRRNTFFVGGGLWALATLIGGVFVAVAYWVIHHSSLRPASPADPSRRPDSPA